MARNDRISAALPANRNELRKARTVTLWRSRTSANLSNVMVESVSFTPMAGTSAVASSDANGSRQHRPISPHRAASTSGRARPSVQNGVIAASTSRRASERPSAVIASTPAPAISATDSDSAAASAMPAGPKLVSSR